MAGRLSRSWDLVKASWDVLQQDKALLVFPLISSIAMLAVVACFALPLIGLGALDGLTRDSSTTLVHYGLAFLFYLAEYFVIFYFNAALVGAAMKRLAGGNPSLGDGFAIANSRLASILGYAFIAATVGMILRAIQERVGFIGKIVVGLIGAGWTLATALVVPVLVAREIGPLDAVKESAGLLKRTWGENVIGQAGMGFAFALIYVCIIAAGTGLMIVAAMANSLAALIVAAIVAVAALMLAFLVHGALSGIYAAALYRYATNAPVQGFAPGALQLAFKPK